MPASHMAQGAPLFGTRIDGVGLILPAGVAVIYLTDVAIHPLAGSPRRVLGLMQWQGHPVVVLDPSRRPVADAPAIRRHTVLVFGAPGAGAALWVDEPPAPIGIGVSADSPAAPDCVFREVLSEPVTDAGGGPQIWWHFSPDALFAVLARPAPGQ